MVLPVSGFLPVPLPMMIPFMGAQSLVIGKMFGEGFQYGKRKISAMPNEEFNQLTFEKMMSNARDEIKASIPTMNAAMQDMQPMVEVVVREFFNYVTLVTKIVTGTGEGENIFQQEGHDIGDWIKEQLGIPHTPHGGTGISVTPPSPITPKPVNPITPQPPFDPPTIQRIEITMSLWSTNVTIGTKQQTTTKLTKEDVNRLVANYEKRTTTLKRELERLRGHGLSNTNQQIKNILIGIARMRFNIKVLTNILLRFR